MEKLSRLNNSNKSKLSLLLLLAILTHFSFTAIIGIYFKYYNFLNYLIDLGVFNQALSTFVKYGVPYYSIATYLEGNYVNWLGNHFSPLVLIFAPIYLIFPKPEFLNAVQSACLAGAAWPIYKACLALKVKPHHAFLWSICYLLNTWIINEAYWEFHELALATPLVAYALYFTIARKFGALFICCSLILLVKEHLGLSVAGFGVVWWWLHKDKKGGFILFLLGIIYFITVYNFIIPYFLGTDNTLTFESGRFSYLKTGLTSEILSKLFLWGIIYSVFILAPFFFTPLVSFFFLFAAISDAAVSLADSSGFHKVILSRHNGPIIPVLVIAACHASIKLKNILKIETIYICLASTLFFFFSTNAHFIVTPKYKDSISLRFGLPDEIDEMRALIPDEAHVAAQANIGVPFADRKYIHLFPLSMKYADYIVIHLDYQFPEFSIEWGVPFYAGGYTLKLQQILSEKEFGIIYWKNNFVLFKKGAEDVPGSREKVKNRLDEMLKQYKFEEYMKNYRKEEEKGGLILN